MVDSIVDLPSVVDTPSDELKCNSDLTTPSDDSISDVTYPPAFPNAELTISKVVQSHPVLTRVESKIDANIKIIPDPVTLPAREPDCGVYTGPAYARSEVSLKDVDLLEEKIIYKKKVQIVERPYEVIREVVKPIVKQVVEFKKIVSETDIVEVPKPYVVTTKNYVPNFKDTSRYAVVNSKSRPNVVYDEDPLPVECLVVDPDVRIIPIHVPKVIEGSIVCKKGLTRLRRLSGITKHEWNALVLKMNPGLCEVGDLDLFPVYKDRMGQVIALKPEAI